MCGVSMRFPDVRQLDSVFFEDAPNTANTTSLSSRKRTPTKRLPRDLPSYISGAGYLCSQPATGQAIWSPWAGRSGGLGILCNPNGGVDAVWNEESD